MTKATLLFCVFLFSACTSSKLPPAPAINEKKDSEAIRFEQIRPVLNARCIACHSCLESPCQLNMQTWEGLRRGAFHENAYNGLRTKAIEPQRMFEDAQTEPQWRARGFIDVLNGGSDSILMKALRLSEARTELPRKTVQESNLCPQDPAHVTTSDVTELAMPYGLPPLSPDQQVLLNTWIAQGARGPAQEPSLQDLNPSVRHQLEEWTKFFNASDLKARITSRYLYEHLFLAHLYFKDEPRTFFKLVRSSTSCDQGIKPIATRRPNNSPGVDKVFYCLSLDKATVTYKNHMPFEISENRLNWLKRNFWGTDWSPSEFPSYDDKVAANPLLAYQEMPVEARFRFLLEEAQYEVMTFIKGPVCNGSFAVNSIQEQFYVFFINPKSDLMVKFPDYSKKVSAQLILPGNLGSNPGLMSIAKGYHDILKHREAARDEWSAQLQKTFPKGLALEDLWDGDGKNDNAVLTVIRHDDNAKVFKGARGDAAKTAFVLDYSTFERLVYDLVVNFDVFDNVSHQMLTRLYMDILRMDAEDTFLQFLPPADRLTVKNQWYQGLATQLKIDLLNEKKFAAIPSGVSFKPGKDPKVQLMQKILFERLNEKVRGPEDTLNWKVLKETKVQNPLELQLKRITSIHAQKKVSPFPNFFPEISVLVIQKEGKAQTTYSIMRNREHQNLSWILSESSRLAPEEDSLTILPGIAGGYPHQFFSVDEKDLKKMIDEILALKSEKQYSAFLKKYGISRLNPDFWNFYDFANTDLSHREPIESGILDLSRYNL